MFRSSTFRLAAHYTALFALAVMAVGAVTLLSMRSELTKLFDAGIQSEAHALSLEYGSEGLEAVVHAVRDRDFTPGHLNYGIEGPGRRPLAGRLAGRGLPAGWSDLKITAGDGADEHIRVLGVDLPDGNRLLVGDDIARNAALDGTLLRSFATAIIGVLLLGAAVGYALSRSVDRRMAAISDTAEAIIDGDLERRVPVRGSGDDLDRLATTFNRMLDRTATLMESLRQVSSDVAHDMRTPLHRLRGHLESGLMQRDDQGRVQAIQSAMTEMDAILDTFSALLRIAQIESGRRRAAFTPIDLAPLAAHVVEAFAPSAEEEGRVLALAGSQPAQVDGDPELLTQMLVNLVENALRHTPEGARISVDVRASPEGPRLSVTDDGPGIAPEERGRVFQRFYRLEASRTTPGSGLGLALVDAVARLHGARVELGDARPGLTAEVLFPQRA
jgi:signal transduction histidine kinase